MPDDVSNYTSEALDRVVRSRLERASAQIQHSLEQVARGNPLGAETDEERAVSRISAKTDLPLRNVEAVAREILDDRSASLENLGPRKTTGKEAILGTIDFVGVSFLTNGRAAADAVVRIAFNDGRAHGSGFMIAPGIIMTNNHVLTLEDDARLYTAEFDYELDDSGAQRDITRFDFAPEKLFVSDPEERLDYTIIALGRRLHGSRDLDRTGFLYLSDANDKHMLGEVANIIQHPKGNFKQLVLRENRLVSRLDYVLHYAADTEPGSSGSPVFNNDWQAIALHHWGGPSPAVLRTLPPGGPLEINEGVRISAIHKDLRTRAEQGVRHASEIRNLLDLWGNAPPRRGVHVPADGSIVVARPVRQETPSRPTKQVRTDMPRRTQSEDFSDRAGYEPGFLPGFIVPLPKLRPNHGHKPARNLEALIGDDPFELPYHHFSIVMSAEHRLAIFTACNIDGRLTRAINRRDKTVNMEPTIADLQIESIGAEASDDFDIDPRIHSDQQMGRPFYEKQKVPGFPDPQSRARIARMFQKGHIIMRSDPAWGTRDTALAAEKDTFYYTNAAPQLGFFNQGSRDDHPGEKGKLRWRAVETYVLRNAVMERERVTVFAGPVFQDGDPEYRGVKVPMLFWKVVVWPAEGELHSIALLADQRPVLEQLTQGLPEAMWDLRESIAVGAEQFDDLAELQRINEFRTTVEHVGELTGLDFSAAVRDSDIGVGREDAPIISEEVTVRSRKVMAKSIKPKAKKKK